MAIKTAVVIAGAVARGAYEAGALKTVLSELLTTEDLRDTLFVDTGAGAINAVLWAGLADGTRPVAEVGEAVCKVWEDLRDTEVFAPLSSAARVTSTLLTGKGRHLLDTAPFAETVRKKLAELSITANGDSGRTLVTQALGFMATTNQQAQTVRCARDCERVVEWDR